MEKDIYHASNSAKVEYVASLLQTRAKEVEGHRATTNEEVNDSIARELEEHGWEKEVTVDDVVKRVQYNRSCMRDMGGYYGALVDTVADFGVKYESREGIGRASAGNDRDEPISPERDFVDVTELVKYLKTGHFPEPYAFRSAEPIRAGKVFLVTVEDKKLTLQGLRKALDEGRIKAGIMEREPSRSGKKKFLITML